MELKEKIIGEIKKIYDPEIPVNIYDLGLIYDVKVDDQKNVYVIMTLLVQFEIINRYNRIIDLILRGLIALHEPLLIKIRKYIPFIGGMDFSPVIVILLLSFFKNLLIDYRLSL